MSMTPDYNNGSVRPLSSVIRSLDVTRKLHFADLPICSVTQNSRQAIRNTLFVAIKGLRADGHDYISHALERGASAVVCEDIPDPLPPCPVLQVPDSRYALSALADAFTGHPSRQLGVVGVTGTDGKTSTTTMLASILERMGGRVGTLGTVSYRLGARSLDSSLTTPDAMSLHQMLREMVDGGLSHACMEVSSHALAMHRTAHVRFDVAVLTNITEDHLDFHGNREGYIRAKQMLFEQLDSDAIAVLNADSPVCSRFAEASPANVLTYGRSHWADVTGDILSMDLGGMRLAIRTPFETYEVSTPLLGDYNCENVLAAATAAFAAGCSSEEVQEALNEFNGVPGRLEKVTVPGRNDLPLVLVDYAHTPNALGKVLSTLRPLVTGDLVCVFGCGGDRETQKRPKMGRAASRLADYTVVTSDNSRSEKTENIMAQILEGIEAPSSHYTLEADRKEAIRKGIEQAARPNSLVAICGKGDESVQELSDGKIPFDDRQVARKILEAMPRRGKQIA